MTMPSRYCDRWCLHFLTFVVVLLVSHQRASCQEEDDEAFGRGRPGLVATWTDGNQTITQLEGRLAFRLSENQTPHPQLSTEQFSGSWRGRLFVQRPGSYRFFAELRGAFQLRLGGQGVLTSESDPSDDLHTIASKPVDLPYGLVLLEAAYEKPRAGSAELRLFWQRTDGHREPIPAWVLRNEPGDETSELARWQAIEKGRRLFESHQCLRCHVGAVPEEVQAETASFEAPTLDSLGGRVYRNWIYHWLQRPRDFRPTTTMPSLFGDSPEDALDLYAATEFLAAQGGPLTSPEEAIDSERAGQGAQAFAQIGCIACHRTLEETGEDFPDLRSLDGLASKTDLVGIRKAIAEPWAFHSESRMPDFEFDAQQPEGLKDLVHYLATGRAETFEQAPLSPSQKALRARFRELVTDATALRAFDYAEEPGRWHLLGREVVRVRGCLACHRLGDLRGRDPGPVNLSALAAAAKGSDPLKGCLASKPPSGVPDFGLRDAERRAIRKFLVWGTSGAESVAPMYRTERRLDRLGCTACHERNGRGGVFAERITRFVSLGSDVTVRDVAPPDLSALGEKLRPEWLRGVIEEGRRSRAWMQLRMPKYPREAVQGLADGLIAADGRDPAYLQSPPSGATPDRVETGRLLVGNTGLGCASCHDVAGIRSTGVRGPDLAGVFGRIRHAWFTQWMLNPQAISPGTRMPSVFFAGKSAAPQYLGGDPGAQLEALWAYLSRGAQMPLPEFGPSSDEVVEGGESPTVVPIETPVLVRGYLGDHGGLRGIALGFPAGTHFGFDSERCRLVSVWQGPFLERQGWFDAGRGGAEKDGDRVLGDVVWRNPPGPEWAISSAEDSFSTMPTRLHGVAHEACWASASDAGFAYRVELDEDLSLSVEDRPAPMDGADIPAFRRHLTIADAPEGRAVWLRLERVSAQTSSFLFYDAEGEPLEKPVAIGGDHSHGVERAAWVSWQTEETPWLLTARGAPAGSRWVLKKTGVANSNQDLSEEAVELWLRFPRAVRDRTMNCEIVFLQQKPNSGNGFKALDDLLSRQSPLVGD